MTEQRYQQRRTGDRPVALTSAPTKRTGYNKKGDHSAALFNFCISNYDYPYYFCVSLCTHSTMKIAFAGGTVGRMP